MAAVGDLLFYRRDQVDLDGVLRQQLQSLRGIVDALPDHLFSEKTDEEIAQDLAKQHAAAPLSVDFTAAKPSVQETQVEVHDQFGFNRGPMRVPGLLATKAVPFKGDAALWRLRTNPFTMNPPRGEVRGNMLIIGIAVPAQQADEAARYIERTLAQLPEYLQRQEAQIAQHNAAIAQTSLQWIKARRQRLGSASDLLKKLSG